MLRAKSICTHYGCSALVSSGSRCELHPYKTMREVLDKKKTPEARSFYSSGRWTKTSLEHRKMEPLCRSCKKKGRTTEGTLVHHNPERQDLIEAGLDPFDHKYLETLCFNCHQGELRDKRNSF